MTKAYSLRNTKIGNSNGFRLPAEFYRDHPQFAEADGWLEVTSDTTAIIKIELPAATDDETENGLMMRLFLDFAIAESLKNQDLQPYTTEMSALARSLIEGVVVDDN